MTEWLATFDYPAEEWLLLDGHLPNGVADTAQRIADRGGRQNKRYAKAIYPELQDTWQVMLEQGVEHTVMYVPEVRRNVLPLSPATADAVWVDSDSTRSMEAIVAQQRQLPPDPGTTRIRDREITTVDLAIGPACRIYEVLLADTGPRSEPPPMERLFHLVLPEVAQKHDLLFRTTWVSDTVQGMAELADRMAASLRFVPRDSGEGPRPVLAAPEARVVFDEVQIGNDLRPLAQHGFVIIEQGVLTLLGSDRQPIDSAPVAEVQASKRGITGGMTVSLTLNGTKYSASPGWGARRPAPIPGLGNPVKDAADTLMRLIERGGGSTR